MKFLTLAINTAFVLMAATAMSETTRDDVIQGLTDEGYTRIETSSTLFGNTKIEAYGPLGEREVVLGKDGAILRDRLESGESDNRYSSSENDNDQADDPDDDENGRDD